MSKISRDLRAGLLHPRENMFGTANLGAINAEVVIDADGGNSFAVDLRGTFNMTIEISGSVDGNNWQLIPVKIFTGSSFGPYLVNIAGAVPGIWCGPTGPFQKLRARVTAWTSGTAMITLVSSQSNLPFDFFDNTPLIVTATGAAGAAVTLTLPNGGNPLRHYLTYLRISRIAAAALTAAATPIIVTTTNLPGSLAFSIQANAALQGEVFSIQEDFAYPLAASVQNTNTTIVCPVTTGVIWRVTAGYQLRP